MAIDLKTASDDTTIGSSAVLFGADATNSSSPSKYPIATVATQIISSGSILTSGGALGTPSGGTLTNCTGLPVSTGVSGLGTGVATAAANAVNASGGLITYATYAPASGKVLTVSNTLTLTGTDSSSVAFGAGGTVAYVGTKQTYTKQQNFGTATLTDGATINWNLDDAQTAKVTLGGNRTMAAPTNLVDGGTYVLRVIQDGTGSRTITWNSVFKWPGGTAPVLSTAASAVDVITFVSDGTNMYGVAQRGFS